MNRVRIGTSNITLPGNKLAFPEAFQNKTRLNYYSSLFNTLEINSSFYKVPMLATFAKWANDVHGDFQFSVKLTKDVTHAKNLVVNPTYLDRFMHAASGVGDRKGCILVQFPGKINLEYYTQVEGVIQSIYNSPGFNGWRIAVELRDKEWYTGETMEMLDGYAASLVLHDMPKSKNCTVNKKANFVYIRYHGPAGDYRGSYTNAFLSGQKKLIQSFIKDGKDVYAYFNNTIGSAYENAITLKNMIGNIK